MARKLFRMTEYLTGGATTGVRRYIHTNGRMTLEDLLVYTAEGRGMSVDAEGLDEIKTIARMVEDAIEAIPNAIMETGKEVRLHDRIRFYPTTDDAGNRLSVQLMNTAFIHSLDGLRVAASGETRKVRATRPEARKCSGACGGAAPGVTVVCPLTGRSCRLPAGE